MLAVSGLALAEGDASVDNILEKGTFILGLDDSFPPKGFRDENNDIVGFDIDVAREVAARLGVEFIAQPISWDAKELELASGTIDCIWNGMSITPEREESMAMTFPYLNNQMIFYTRADAGHRQPGGSGGQVCGGAERLLCRRAARRRLCRPGRDLLGGAGL